MLGLIEEADRLVDRAEQLVERLKSETDPQPRAEAARLILELKRLQLYRTVVRNLKSPQALMPEWAHAQAQRLA
jgi:hypothetical protein